MSILGRLLALFPFALGILAGASAVWWSVSGGLLPLALLLFIVYAVPVVAFRIHQSFWPVKLGVCRMVGNEYVAWWGAHQLQLVYIAFPQLEAALRLVPGLYSAWLRCWGARIGKGVYWTPLVEISDRNLLAVGDGVVVGHRAGFYAHIIRPTRDNLMLYCKPVCIGAGAFIGAAAVIGPGAEVKDRAFIEAGARVHPNETVSGRKKTPSERSE